MSETETSLPLAKGRIIGFSSLFGVLAVTTLIGSQFITVGGTMVYSLIVLMHLSESVAYGLYAVFATLSLWGLLVVGRLAWEAETDPVNN